MHPDYAKWKFNRTRLLRRARNVIAVARELEKEGPIALALCGTSGIWLASELVLNNLDVILVRKESERSHGYQVECADYSEIIRSKNIYFVDDLISSGHTVQYVIETLNKVNGKLKGVILHDPDSHFFEGRKEELYEKKHEYRLDSGDTVTVYIPNSYLINNVFEAEAHTNSHNPRP